MGEDENKLLNKVIFSFEWEFFTLPFSGGRTGGRPPLRTCVVLKCFSYTLPESHPSPSHFLESVVNSGAFLRIFVLRAGLASPPALRGG